MSEIEAYIHAQLVEGLSLRMEAEMVRTYGVDLTPPLMRAWADAYVRPWKGAK